MLHICSDCPKSGYFFMSWDEYVDHRTSFHGLDADIGYQEEDV